MWEYGKSLSHKDGYKYTDKYYRNGRWYYVYGGSKAVEAASEAKGKIGLTNTYVYNGSRLKSSEAKIMSYGGKSNIIDKAKDKLGFDEKANYKYSQQRLRESQHMLDTAKTYKNDPSYNTEGAQDFINRSIKEYSTETAMSKAYYSRMKYEYQKTPLGKFESAVKSAKDWIKKLTGW